MVRVILCFFMLLSVSANALAGLHVHNEESTISQSHQHDSDKTSSSDNCDDDCFLHCGVWHILTTLEKSSFTADPTVYLSNSAWAVNHLVESRFNQRLWRPPALRS